MNTIPGMPCIYHDQYDIDGIRVERFTTAPKEAAHRPPLICVHGGCHASWSWQEHASVYVAAGYEVHALNWRGRGGSAAIDDDSLVKMSIADVVDDIDKVARCFDTPPVLIAHSMGGLAAQLYASAHEVGALVLLTPVVPSNVGATPIELPISNMDAPWGPPPPDVARQMFFQGLDDMQAAHFNALLVPESPLRVYEATRWSLGVDAKKLTAPILIVSGALDILTPPETGAALAALYGATYQLEPAHGHNVLLGKGARRIAEDVIGWVVGIFAHSAPTDKRSTPLTPEQIQLVQASFAKIAPIARPVAALFYQRLLNLDPTVEALFKGDMREQGRKLMAMIGTAVNGLDQLASIVPAVKALGVRHARYGVGDAHYATAGAALMWTLEQALGDDFTPSVSAGWSAAFELLADTMQAAAREARR